MAEPFKECSLCGTAWENLAAFVCDPDLAVEGYQACHVAPEWSLILLTHTSPGCGTTLAVRASALKHLDDGSAGRFGVANPLTLLGLCREHPQLEAPAAEAEVPWVQSVLQCLRRHELPPHLATAASWSA
jgi:hypothetical protein